MKPNQLLSISLGNITAVVVVSILVLGCSSGSQSVKSDFDRRSETPEALYWYDKADQKRVSLEKHLAMSSPESVLKKTIQINSPDSGSTDSLTLFIGDVANLAYLVKIGKVYLNDLCKDALSYSAEAYRVSNLGAMHHDFFVKQLQLTSARYFELTDETLDLFTSYNQSLSNVPDLAKINTLEVTGMLEKETALLNSLQDIQNLQDNLIKHALEKASVNPLMIGFKKDVVDVKDITDKKMLATLKDIKTGLLRRSAKLEQKQEALIRQSLISQMLSTTRMHIQTCKSIERTLKDAL